MGLLTTIFYLGSSGLKDKCSRHGVKTKLRKQKYSSIPDTSKIQTVIIQGVEGDAIRKRNLFGCVANIS